MERNSQIAKLHIGVLPIGLFFVTVQQFAVTQEIIASLPGVTSMKANVVKMFECWPIPIEFISSF